MFDLDIDLLMFRIPGMGEILTASSTSKEDHGYIMDLEDTQSGDLFLLKQ